MKEKLKTSLPLAAMNTPTIQVGVPMPQIRSQLGLVIYPTLVNQNLNREQLVTPLIARQPNVVPYPMWYNRLPPFVPMDPNMYFMYYYGIKGPNPLISGRKEKYVANTTRTKLMPLIE